MFRNFSDDLGAVHFKDLLFSTLKRVYNNELNSNTPKKARDFLIKIEKKTIEKIDSKPAARFNLTNLKRSMSPKSGPQLEEGHKMRPKKHFNSMFKLFYCQMTFRTWKKCVALEIMSAKKQKLKQINTKFPLV